ncbi:aldose epimerase family protein [Rubrimonas cliftonensis]|uniref:Aldose 1-epimerase n=1 Tax=Rubrimonas cliftonensis TaxID=89524 RepID=A0A1H3VM32_9RHOB|nr:aldose epimerase family protein [Rubrimonas cliftonensis]SDZ75863.1 aldose 1-epimerase [Rubrimonas cliftonensis]
MTAHMIDHGDGLMEARLEHGDALASILNLGCVLRDWRAPLGGRLAPAVLGYADPRAYRGDGRWFGAVVGRVANRIAHGRFRLEGRDHALPLNDGPHHLHGGPDGLSRRLWAMETDDAASAVRLSLVSPDGDQGYPGALALSVDIALGRDGLTYAMAAEADRPTPVNLAQHAYYNLGPGDVRRHVLRVDAAAYTPTGADLIPTGEVAPVAGTRFDFRRPRALAEADPEGAGHDVNLALDPARDTGEPAAEAWAPGGLRLRLWTDQPGLQVYDGAGIGEVAGGLDGARHSAFGGLCLEAQGFPDSPNRPGFPSIIHGPGAPYRQRLRLALDPAPAAAETDGAWKGRPEQGEAAPA